MAALAPDYSSLFGSEKLSDITLVIEEETQGVPANAAAPQSKGKRKRAAVGDAGTSDQAPRKALPAHGVVLYGVSSFCQTKLESWSSSSNSSTAGKPEILITVPAGQLEAGELLVRGMYAATPDLSGCSQAQLLQLLLLADRYGTSKVLEAVTAAFSSIPTADLQWDTVLAVYSLPPGCTELDACKGLFTAAGEKLQQELGDLELLWADKQGQKQQLLLGLPYRALLQLLQDPATRVASENTVFYTIQRWQQQQLPDPCDGQVLLLRKLVRQVRMQHCTQLFVATVMSRSPLAVLCFSPAELAIATSYSSIGLPTATADHRRALNSGCPVVAKYPAWSLPQRPASAMKQLTLDWQLPLQQLQQLVEQHLQDTAKPAYKGGEHHMWQGQQFALQVEIVSSGEGAGKTTKVGLFVTTPKLPPDAVRRITFSVTAAKAAPSSNTGDQQRSAAQPSNIKAGPWTHHFSAAVPSWGVQDMLLSLCSLSSWSQAEAKLRELQLVHADGCLHLKGEVTAML